jgi:hypothetical protein
VRVQGATNVQIASATGYVVEQLGGAGGELTVLGAFPNAVYLQLVASEVVLAVLSADAVRLPIGLVLAAGSSRLALASVTEASLEDGELVLQGLRVIARADRSAVLRPVGRPRQQLGAPNASSIGLPPELVAALGTDPALAVPDLIGRGPGLTPSGDDLLCGLLAGCVLFEVPADDVRQAVLDVLASRPRATTSLSRALLRRAAAGEGIEQLSTLAEALCGTDPATLAQAWQALRAVGHSSGAALGLGLLTAAEYTDVSTIRQAG